VQQVVVVAQEPDRHGAGDGLDTPHVDALEPSLVILNRPISAVERTWVPPHSSRE
jgi:hypothetical protein